MFQMFNPPFPPPHTFLTGLSLCVCWEGVRIQTTWCINILDTLLATCASFSIIYIKLKKIFRNFVGLRTDKPLLFINLICQQWLKCPNTYTVTVFINPACHKRARPITVNEFVERIHLKPSAYYTCLACNIRRRAMKFVSDMLMIPRPDNKDSWLDRVNTRYTVWSRSWLP